MMTHTDRHFRYFLRLISKNALLYTEMLTTGALIHGDRDQFLLYNKEEHPLALQLGGSDPGELALCSQYAEDYGYDEVNINIGCPSDRVQSGQFGVCLMARPELVAECVNEMQNRVSIPVTVKTRIGVDDMDSYENLCTFVTAIRDAGCHTIIVHARKAWLNGLSPRQNREIPPLRYDFVYNLKNDFPELEVIINGGITTLEECHQHLQKVDGVMLGRAVCHNSYLLAAVDKEIYNDESQLLTRDQILYSYLPYIEQQLANGVYLNRMSRHILGLYQGQQGARTYRRLLSEHAHKKDADTALIKEAMRHVQAA